MNNSEKKYSIKNLASLTCDAGVKTIMIDGLGSAISGIINDKISLSEISTNIPVSFFTYFARNLAREYVDHSIVKEHLGENNYLLPYIVGAIAGGFKSGAQSNPINKNSNIFKGSIKTLAYEISNDYNDTQSSLKLFSSILATEQSVDYLGDKIFGTDSNFKDIFAESLIYTAVINYAYIPTTTYCTNQLNELISNIGVSQNDASHEF